MLGIYGETKRSQHLYIGIARKDWDPDILAGDLLIGECNRPDILIREDLFTDHDWKFTDWAEDNEDNNPISRFLESLEDTPLFVPDLLESPNSGIPNAVLNIHNHFGSSPSDFEGSWAVWVAVKVAKILEDLGIPLDVEGRKKWAQKIPSKIDRILVKSRKDNIRQYSVSYMVPSKEKKNEWELKEVEWSDSGEDESFPEFT